MGKRRKQHFNRGEWEVQRERCQITDKKPPPPFQSRKMSDVVGRVMQSLHLDEKMWTEQMEGDWEALLGPQVAKHTRPGRMYKQALTIFVGNSAWLHELQRFGKDEILAKLQEKYGEDKIQSIRFQIDPDGTL